MNITEELRYRLYFNKYRYKIVLTSRGIVHCTCFNGYKSFLRAIEHNIQSLGVMSVYKSYDLDEIERFNDWQEKFPKVRHRTEFDRYTIFVNDLHSQEAVAFQTINNTCYVVEAIVGEDEMPIRYFRTTPKHKYRAFFAGKQLSIEEKIELVKIIKETDLVTPSSAFKQWTNTGRYGLYLRLQPTLYIDYDNPSTYTWLQMVTGGLLSTRYRLERKNEDTTS